MKQKRIFSLALAAALALSLTACQSGGGESSSQDSPAAGVAVQVQEVTVDTISTENKVSGRVVTDGQESVFVAAQTQCTALFVEVGDSVTAGQTLCTLDMASTLSSYSAASISYNSAVQSYQDQAAIFDKQIALAEKNVSDLKALFEIGAASVLENVDSQGNVIAPISGTIIALNAAEGSYVTPSAPVAVIDGVDQLEVSVSVSEALVPKLAEGDEVDVSISALGKQLVGSIKKIENTASMQTKLYNVTISILEDVEGLMSGMFADVSFRTDTSADTVVIPTEAILTSNGAQYVFVVDGIVEGRGTARYAAIGTGLTGSGVTEVTSGLGAGDMLVTVGQAYLSDGDAVRIVTGED